MHTKVQLICGAFLIKKFESNNLSLDEAIDAAQNRPLWRLMSAFGANALLVAHAKNEDDLITWQERISHVSDVSMVTVELIRLRRLVMSAVTNCLVSTICISVTDRERQCETE